MDKVIRYGLLIFVCLCGFSCKKEHKKTIIDGIVRDFTTGLPLEGVEVYLQMGYNKNVDHPFENPETFQSFITGSDGKFHTEFHALKKYNYALEYQKPSQCYFDGSPGQTINKGETNNIDIKLHSYSTLYIHVKNVSPFDSNDKICYYLDKNATGCVTPPIVGMAVDFIDDINENVYKKVYIKSFITKNGVTTSRLDSITMSAPCTNQTFNLFY